MRKFDEPQPMLRLAFLAVLRPIVFVIVYRILCKIFVKILAMPLVFCYNCKQVMFSVGGCCSADCGHGVLGDMLVIWRFSRENDEYEWH